MNRVINLGLICAFVFGIALAASPKLHDQVHSAAQHECAATLIASGNCEHSAPPPLFVKPIATEDVDLAIAPRTFVPSLFLNACLLEHAPPQNS